MQRTSVLHVLTWLQGDEPRIRRLLATSGRVLANTVDENRRRWGLQSALCCWHSFCCSHCQTKL
jgi:hypothetical protein